MVTGGGSKRVVTKAARVTLIGAWDGYDNSRSEQARV